MPKRPKIQEDAEDADVVRAVYLGDPLEKQYHYRVPNAQIGDLVTGPGATGPARVVGLGRKEGWPYEIKTGRRWQQHPQKGSTTASSMTSASSILKDAYIDPIKTELNRQLYGGSAIVPLYAKGTSMQDMPTDLTPVERVAWLRKEADLIEHKEAEREAYRIEAERAASTRKRQLESARAVMENLMHNGKNEQIRLQAASMLHRMVA